MPRDGMARGAASAALRLDPAVLAGAGDSPASSCSSSSSVFSFFGAFFFSGLGLASFLARPRGFGCGQIFAQVLSINRISIACPGAPSPLRPPELAPPQVLPLLQPPLLQPPLPPAPLFSCEPFCTAVCTY